MKESGIYLEDKMMTKQKQHKERMSETYGTMRRSMMRDKKSTGTKVGVMTRSVKIKALEEIL